MTLGAAGSLRGSFAYEFRMQVRRPAVWIVLLLVIAATVAGSHAPFRMLPLSLFPKDRIAGALAGAWAAALQALCPAAFGCLLADRVARERRLRVDELVESFPMAPGRLLLGKYLGTAAATLLPILAAYAAGAVYLTATHGTAVLPQAAAAFVLTDLPGLLFVAAFSIGCPAVMPVALYQFLFVGYWFWGNFLPPSFRIPTISQTILTPRGHYARAAFFPGLAPAVAPTTGLASVALLLAVGALALWATALVLGRQRAARSGGGPGAGASRSARARREPDASGAGRAALLRYELRILGRSVLLTPLLIVAVFDLLALLTAFAGGHGGIVARVLTAALEIGMSLGAGIAAANLVAAEPAAELHLALPRGYRATALRRLAIAVVWTCAVAALMAGILAATGGWLTDEPFLRSQLTWAAPILWMAGLGALLALVIRSRAGSVGVVTGVWLAEFIAHGLFRTNPWLRPVELFATSFAIGAPWWLGNRLELIGMAGAFVLGCWWLLGNGEALVGGAQE